MATQNIHKPLPVAPELCGPANRNKTACLAVSDRAILYWIQIPTGLLELGLQSRHRKERLPVPSRSFTHV